LPVLTVSLRDSLCPADPVGGLGWVSTRVYRAAVGTTVMIDGTAWVSHSGLTIIFSSYITSKENQLFSNVSRLPKHLSRKTWTDLGSSSLFSPLA